MLAFIVRRLFQAILVTLVVALISFSLFQFVGDPISNMVGQETTTAQREALREQLGLNDPVPVQFVKWLGNAVQGDFGRSYRMGKPVGELIAQRLPATLELVLVSALLALAIGVPMGVYTGLHRESWLSRVFLTVSLIVWRRFKRPMPGLVEAIHDLNPGLADLGTYLPVGTVFSMPIPTPRAPVLLDPIRLW